MSSYDKVVKLACKPKAANPKAKYLDPIIAATWSDDGAVHDVCKALSPRFREPNAVVVFKALIVLHTMIRNGATDNVLSYLSSEDILRLRNVASGQWEGYDAPRNLKNYAFYLDSRIRAYKELKHDAVKVQSETNRDMRFSNVGEESRSLSGQGRGGSGNLQRSKTLAGRKLRSMTVEKGLLRETKAVQQMIDALVQCKFYLDDLEDELNVTALRMLVKDILVLFQACNEGVINVLENYFEMSRIDAGDALGIYRHFCKETEQVMEYLSNAKKLENLLQVPIPHLKHAPISLVGALEEYLKDPNFEQNRLEYKANKAAADRTSGTPGTPLKSALKKGANGSTPTTPPVPKLDPAIASGSSTSPKTTVNQAVVDFLDSIEKDIGTSNGAGPSMHPSPMHPSPTFNPFLQRQSMLMPPQMTGMFAQQQQPFIQGQPTGFLPPQQTAMMMQMQTSLFPPQQTSPFPPQMSPFPQQQQNPVNPFAQQLQQQPTPTNPFPTLQQTGGQSLQLPQQNTGAPFQQQRQSMFLQSQTTGMLQPQTTGSNPFRQSMLFPQSTGAQSFGTGASLFMSSTPQQPQSAQGMAFSGSSIQRASSPNGTPFSIPNRPQSTPITSQKQMQPLTVVATHTTGTKNPFGAPVMPAPPVPKLPTLEELATGAFGTAANTGMGPTSVAGQLTGQTVANGQQRSQTVPPQQQSPVPSTASNSLMASVASSFATKSGQESTSSPSSTNPFPFLGAQNTASTSSFSNFSSGLSSHPTGTTAQTTAASVSSLQPQTTGFGGMKPFKPTSSFGATLLESLPPIADSPSKPSSPFMPSFSNGLKPNSTGFHMSTPTGLPSSSTSSSSPFPSSSLTTGLQPSATGLPSNNTFNSPFSSGGVGAKPTQMTGALNAQPTGMTAFGSSSGMPGGLKPQMTGGSNPFRASMMMPSTMPSFATTGTQPFLPTNSSFNSNPMGTSPFSTSNGGPNPSQSPFPSQPSQQQTPGIQTGSLI